MDYSKKWYLSKTIWGALIAVAAPLFQLVGIELSSDIQAQITDSIVTIAGASGGLLALFGRLSASRRLIR